MMTLMQAHNRQGAVHCDGLRAGHKLCGSGENGGLVEHFFGRDGKDLLEHETFVQFLRNLHDEVSSYYPPSGKLQISVVTSLNLVYHGITVNSPSALCHLL